MPNITYIDGKYLNYEDSKIHINDRGYHFGDSVYEVIVFNKNIFYDFDLLLLVPIPLTPLEICDIFPDALRG